MITKQVYIMNMKSSYIYKNKIEKNDDLKIKDNIKLYSATIPYSLETIRMYDYKPNEFYELMGKLYTDCIINVEFKDKYYVYEELVDENTGEIYFKKKVLANNKKIRKNIYNEGFEFKNNKYVFYKRGAGKAKTGDALFIKEDMVQFLRNRSRLGLDFSKDNKIDFTSILAYESLIMSGIEMTIELNPKTEILLISDIDGSNFKTIANITEEVDGELHSSNKEIEKKNCLTDGHGLLDSSIFNKYGKNKKAFMLLRNDFFKCCAFNTNIQSFFKENNVEKLKDMFGNEYDASKIKLIITPNSLKFLKFSNKFENKNDCYINYINSIDSTFGVVKFDKRGNYGNYNRTTYQLLNSIPYLTKEDLKNLSREEVNYINLLHNDSSVFLNYIGMDSHASIEFEELSETEDCERKMDNIELINALLLTNSDIQYTSKFKKIKKELIKNRIKYLQMGKLRLKNTIYATMVSNPYEMLLHSIGKYDDKSIMEGREIWCPQYSDGQELCASRNPHINSGNVMYAKNIYRNEYKWFNFNENICVVNFYDNDMPDRLQGCDTDSDTLLLLPSRVFVEYSKLCEENFPTPINMVEGKPKLRKNDMDNLATLDTLLSENYIGKIINLSQIANSYMNHAVKNNYPQEIIDDLYNASCKCSSLSQIEIDKSKKSFDNVNMAKELSKIRNCNGIKFVEENNIKKMVVPKFFSKISDFNEYRVFEKMDTPMDLLEDVLKFEKLIRTKDVEFKDLLIQPKEISGNSIQRQIILIYDIIVKCGKKINGLRMNKDLNSKAKKTIEKNSKNEAISELMNLSISNATILDILRMAMGVKSDKYGFSKYSMLTLNLLYLTNGDKVLRCFKCKDMSEDEVLCKNINGNYNIFGVKYIKEKRKNL